MLLVEIALVLQCTAEYWLNEDTARHDGNAGEVNTHTVSVCTLFILIRSPLADAICLPVVDTKLWAAVCISRQTQSTTSTVTLIGIFIRKMQQQDASLMRSADITWWREEIDRIWKRDAVIFPSSVFFSPSSFPLLFILLSGILSLAL